MFCFNICWKIISVVFPRNFWLALICKTMDCAGTYSVMILIFIYLTDIICQLMYYYLYLFYNTRKPCKNSTVSCKVKYKKKHLRKQIMGNEKKALQLKHCMFVLFLFWHFWHRQLTGVPFCCFYRLLLLRRILRLRGILRFWWRRLQ